MKFTTMKKVLVAVATAGALAVPGGMALAQDETPEPAPATTCVPDRDRGRDSVDELDQMVAQAQDRVQLRLHDGTCDGTCTGDQVRDRDQVHLEDGTGLGAQSRQGEMGRFGNGRGNG
jgi:hypothetical protein